MSTRSVFGAQWGDEGKGKIIDLWSSDSDVVVRYQGGANAGHTVVVDGQKFVLHLLPSGILHEGRVNVIANGLAVDPITLLEEMDALEARGISVGPERLRLSAAAHVIFDVHQRMDKASEKWRGAGRIGTTGRGIGPCYADKASRTGLRVADLVDRERLRARLEPFLAEKNAILERVHEAPTVDFDEAYSRYAEIGARLAPFVTDTGRELREMRRQGKRILFEGAQGTMLDIDHGSYPFVTSSNTGVHGIGAGAGFPPHMVEEIFGVAKAYCTRVGEGPFPSELEGEAGDKIRRLGNEYGATTGRPRRCGWFDAVQVRYALELNGATGWVMTNLDVLSGFDEVQVATSYDIASAGLTGVRDYPSDLADLNAVEARFEARPGWSADITAVRTYGDLPRTTRDYVEWVEELVGCPIVMLSVGPAREEVISRTAP